MPVPAASVALSVVAKNSSITAQGVYLWLESQITNVSYGMDSPLYAESEQVTVAAGDPYHAGSLKFLEPDGPRGPLDRAWPSNKSAALRCHARMDATVRARTKRAMVGSRRAASPLLDHAGRAPKKRASRHSERNRSNARALPPPVRVRRSIQQIYHID